MERSQSGDSSPPMPLWKQLQARAKPRPGAREPTDERRERGVWMFRRTKRPEPAALDRVLSSSQPDLLLSSPGDGGSAAGRAKSSSPDKPTVALLLQSHHKSSSLGSACLERLAEPPGAGTGSRSSGGRGDGAAGPGGSLETSDPGAAVPPSGFFKLDLELKRGFRLAARDRGGSSDPYVKVKLGGKEVFRSKTVHKNLNPVWEQKTSLVLDGLTEPLYVKVFDYDFARQDDFMGSALLSLESLEQRRSVPVTLALQDPDHPDQDLGSLELSVTLTPKRSPLEERRDSARSLRQFGGVLSVLLIEGRDLTPMDSNGLSDPYVKFRLGTHKYRSKTVPKTLSPQWREQFDLQLDEDSGSVLEITVWDRDAGRRDDFIGRCQVDFSGFSKDQTHRLEVPLEESQGILVLLVTLTALAIGSDLTAPPLENPAERQEIVNRYRATKCLSNLKDVGVVQVKVMRAEGLKAADVTGKSDPFCVLELVNDRLQTHTVYKNLNPEWNKVFMFNVKDVHSVLEVTVFDQDRDRSADFLGKVAIPLLRVRNGEQRVYVLKNKELTAPTKGVLHLEIEVIYNTVKAAMRTVVPAEQKYLEEEPKVSKQLLQQNFNRVKRCIMVLISYGNYVNSCFEWESTQRSIVSFLLFIVVVWNFELYMVPLALLLLLVWNLFFCSGRDDESLEAMLDWEDEDEDKEDKDSEPRGFMDKLSAIQDVVVSVQNALDQVASHAERLKNTLNWTVPFLSGLAVAALCSVTLLLYVVPLRLLLLLWGVNKFTKKLRDPFGIDNNELLDFLSRVPSDVQLMQYSELRVDPGQSPSKRRRTNQS